MKAGSDLSLGSCIRQDNTVSDSAETWIFRYGVGESENDIGDGFPKSTGTNLGLGIWEKQSPNSAIQGHGQYFSRFRMVHLFGKSVCVSFIPFN